MRGLVLRLRGTVVTQPTHSRIYISRTRQTLQRGACVGLDAAGRRECAPIESDHPKRWNKTLGPTMQIRITLDRPVGGLTSNLPLEASWNEHRRNSQIINDGVRVSAGICHTGATHLSLAMWVDGGER